MEKKHPELKITNIIFKLQDGQCSTIFITNYTNINSNMTKDGKYEQI